MSFVALFPSEHRGKEMSGEMLLIICRLFTKQSCWLICHSMCSGSRLRHFHELFWNISEMLQILSRLGIHGKKLSIPTKTSQNVSFYKFFQDFQTMHVFQHISLFLTFPMDCSCDQRNRRRFWLEFWTIFRLWNGCFMRTPSMRIQIEGGDSGTHFIGNISHIPFDRIFLPQPQCGTVYGVEGTAAVGDHWCWRSSGIGNPWDNEQWTECREIKKLKAMTFWGNSCLNAYDSLLIMLVCKYFISSFRTRFISSFDALFNDHVHRLNVSLSLNSARKTRVSFLNAHSVATNFLRTLSVWFAWYIFRSWTVCAIISSSFWTRCFVTES